MKYLITGGAGFIGSNLAARFIERGDEVAVIDNLSTGSFDNIANLNLTFVKGDILHRPLLQSMVDRADYVIHFAAALGVKLILQEPVECMTTNVEGTRAVLEACAVRKTPVLVASTSEVYGKSTQIPFTEDNDIVMGPSSKSRWSYAASKLLDEFMALSYFEEKGLPTQVVRFFNTVGPRQNGQYGMVLPNFVRQAINNEDIVIHGTGDQTRCFCDVRDTVEAVIRLTDARIFGEVVNIGSTEEISINGLASLVKTLTNSKSHIRRIPYSEAYKPGYEDMMRRVPSVEKLYALTGFRPRTTLNEIVTRTANQMRDESVLV